jgi:hypothetical protein
VTDIPEELRAEVDAWPGARSAWAELPPAERQRYAEWVGAVDGSRRRRRARAARRRLSARLAWRRAPLRWVDRRLRLPRGDEAAVYDDPGSGPAGLHW